jgi:hypothetical protein
MFNLCIDNKYFLLINSDISFSELFKTIAPVLVQYKRGDKYSEIVNSQNLAKALKDIKDVRPVQLVDKLSLSAITTNFKNTATTIWYYTRSGDLIISTPRVFFNFNLLTKIVSVYQNDSQTIVTDTAVSLAALMKVIEFAAPELTMVPREEPAKKEKAVETKKLVTKTVEKSTVKKAVKEKPKTEAITNAVAEGVIPAQHEESIPIISLSKTLQTDDDLPSVEDVFKNSDVFLSVGDAGIENA